MFAALTPKTSIFGNHAVGDFHVITMTEQQRQVVYVIAGAWRKISSTRKQNFCSGVAQKSSGVGCLGEIPCSEVENGV